MDIIAHEETVMELMNQLVYATKHDIGDIMAHKEIFTAGTSAVNNAYKILTTLVDSGKLEKGGGDYFKLKEARGNHQEHSRLITAALIKILKLDYQTIIHREHEISEKGLRPDAIILLVNGDKSCCRVLEVMNHESQDYINQKIHTWDAWEGAEEYLSKLFNTNIKFYDICISVDDFLKEVSK